MILRPLYANNCIFYIFQQFYRFIVYIVYIDARITGGRCFRVNNHCLQVVYIVYILLIVASFSLFARKRVPKAIEMFIAKSFESKSSSFRISNGDGMTYPPGPLWALSRRHADLHARVYVIDDFKFTGDHGPRHVGSWTLT